MMSKKFTTQIALAHPEHRAQVAAIADRLEALLSELDAIGPMMASAQLAHAIDTLRSSIADQKRQAGG
jgi:hypothetical protein